MLGRLNHPVPLIRDRLKGTVVLTLILTGRAAYSHLDRVAALHGVEV
jgi:hypothetical protein